MAKTSDLEDFRTVHKYVVSLSEKAQEQISREFDLIINDLGDDPAVEQLSRRVQQVLTKLAGAERRELHDVSGIPRLKQLVQAEGEDLKTLRLLEQRMLKHPKVDTVKAFKAVQKHLHDVFSEEDAALEKAG